MLPEEVITILLQETKSLVGRNFKVFESALRRAAQELPLEWWQQRLNLTVEELLRQSEIRWRVGEVAAEVVKATRAAAAERLPEAVKTVAQEIETEFFGLPHPPIKGGVMETEQYLTREWFAWGSEKEEGHYTETVPLLPKGAHDSAAWKEIILARLAEVCGLQSPPVEIEEGAEEGAEPESSILREARRIYKELFVEVECRLRNEDKYESPVRVRVAVPRGWLSES
jgi:hypothetical protein